MSASKELREILETYSNILGNKKILSEATTSLNNMNLANVKVDNDNTKYDSVNSSLIGDVQKAAKNAGLVVTITTAKSGHSKKTTSGNRSRHPEGNAVDISIINGVSSSNPAFRGYGDSLKNELVKMGYVWNAESGNDKAILWRTKIGGNHYNHVHVSRKSTGSDTGEDINRPEIGSTEDYGTDEINFSDPILKALLKSLFNAKNPQK